MADEIPQPTNTPEQMALQFALANPAIPKLYCNAIGGFLNTSDVSFMLSLNNTTVGVLTMSYPVAKAFTNSLSEMIAKFETITGTSVASASDLEGALRSAAQSPMKSAS